MPRMQKLRMRRIVRRILSGRANLLEMFNPMVGFNYHLVLGLRSTLHTGHQFPGTPLRCPSSSTLQTAGGRIEGINNATYATDMR